MRWPFVILVLVPLLAMADEDGKNKPEVPTREVEYQAGAVKAVGYLALPASADSNAPVPGVLIVHEWWGNNDYTRGRARQLASKGYAALALDMYGEGTVADHPSEASRFSAIASANQKEMRERFEAGMMLLQGLDEVDGSKIAAIGYCFGGGVVLQMACNGVRGLTGVASFHGSLSVEEPNRPVKMHTKVLVCHGGEDVLVRKKKVEEFKAKMEGAGADMKFVLYPNAMHGFTNPDATRLGEKFNLPLVYSEEADLASWEELLLFLTEIFADEPKAQPPAKQD